MSRRAFRLRSTDAARAIDNERGLSTHDHHNTSVVTESKRTTASPGRALGVCASRQALLLLRCGLLLLLLLHLLVVQCP